MLEKLLQICREANPAIPDNPEAKLIDEGYVDSFGAFMILTSIEMDFGITIPESEIKYHACGQRMMFTALCNGMTLYLLQGFTPSRWLNIVKNAAITYTMTAPAQLAQIVLNEQISGCSFPNLKLVSKAVMQLHLGMKWPM